MAAGTPIVSNSSYCIVVFIISQVTDIALVNIISLSAYRSTKSYNFEVNKNIYIPASQPSTNTELWESVRVSDTTAYPSLHTKQLKPVPVTYPP